MTRSEYNWTSVFVLFSIVAFIYSLSVYSAFFESRMGYLYDPETDRLFKLEFGVSINRYDKNSPLIPFRDMYYGNVVGVEYVGKYHDILSEINNERNPMINEIEVYREVQKKKMEGLMDDVRSLKKQSYYTVDSLYIEYFTRWDVDAVNVLPKKITTLESFDGNRTDSFVVDAVIMRRVISTQAASVEPVKAEVIRKAVLLRGEVAHELWMLGL